MSLFFINSKASTLETFQFPLQFQVASLKVVDVVDVVNSDGFISSSCSSYNFDSCYSATWII